MGDRGQRLNPRKAANADIREPAIAVPSHLEVRVLQELELVRRELLDGAVLYLSFPKDTHPSCGSTTRMNPLVQIENSLRK
jgi:hypothetical protein